MMRKAFTLFELILVIGLISLLFLGLRETLKSQKIDQTHINELRTLQALDTGLTQSFDDIVEAYANTLGNINDSDTKWGWNKNNKVSPFPAYLTVSGTKYLVYNLNSTGIGTAKLKSLRSRIVHNFNGACRDWSAKVSPSTQNVYLYCEDLANLRYNLSDGTSNLSRAHTLGSAIDPSKIPTAMITFKKRDGAGNFAYNDIYTVSFGNVYSKRQVLTANKLAEMRSAIENFTNATKLKEIANTENADKSGGLNNMDDEFVGWHWKIFGNKLSSINATFCNKPAGGGSCTNLNSSNIWRSGSNIRRGLISRRFVNNLMSGDKSYYVDGFGNGIYIYPTASQCGGTNYMSCRINALLLPADDYIKNSVPNIPPFATIIYTEPFANKSVAGQPYGRVIVAY